MKRTIVTVGIVIMLGITGCTTADTNVSTNTDKTLTNNQIKELVTGTAVSYSPGGGRALYRADGSYRFSDNRGTWNGRYYAKGNRLCVDFDNDNSRCDKIIQRGSRYFFISARSGREYRMSIRPGA